MEYEMVDLCEQAIEEARLVTHARTYARPDQERAPADCERSVPLIARARRCDTRRRLACRLLLIFRVGCTDSMGRVVSESLVGVLVGVLHAPDTGRRPRDRIRAMAVAAEAAVRGHVWQAAADWIQKAESISAAFGAARVRRERAIDAQTPAARPQLFQAGLFDRRAERARSYECAARIERDEAVRARLRRVDQSQVDAAVDLLLVLTP